MSNLERIQKYIIVLILLLVLVIAGGILIMWHQEGDSTGAASPAASYGSTELTEVKWYYPDNLCLGQQLTTQTFTLPDGGATTLAEHLGSSYTLAVFWGSWCSYCEEQTELLLSAQQTLAQQGVTVLLIDKMDPEKESLDAAQQTIAEKNIPFDWVIDDDLSVYKELGLHIIPTSFLLDAQGRVLYCHTGGIQTKDELDAMLAYAREGAAAQTLAFIQNQLMTEDGGVQMHIQAQSASSPSGQDVLAESQGLLMEYANLMGNDAVFRTAYGYVQQQLDVNGLLRWYGTTSGQPAPVNALLDDLRVLRALDAENRRSGGYDTVLAYHAAALAANMLDDAGNLVDFYTFSDGSKAHRLTMCYADWTALNVLVQQQPACAAAVQAAQKLVDGAYLGDSFPFYANYYDYETGRYDDGSLNMAEAMLTLLHQAEADRLPAASLEWLHTQMAGNGIWARYDTSGKIVPGSEYQSSAVYAIVGMIALECQDDILLTQAVSRMEQYRCFDATNPLNGAFASSLDTVSSFDQCMALVLYAKIAH